MSNLCVALVALLAPLGVVAEGPSGSFRWGEFKAPPAAQAGGPVMVTWNSEEGRRRLARASASNDFFQLAHAFVPQENPIYAGPATMVMILNAMRMPKHTVPSQKALEIHMPKALGGQVQPFPAYSQRTLLNAETDRVKPRSLIELRNVTPANENDRSQFKPGTGLVDLQGILGVYGARSEVTFADAKVASGAPRFRKVAREVLGDGERFLVINFARDVLGGAPGGTVSPVAAYDEVTDSMLVLDVAGHKNPWFWAPVEWLYRAMNTSYEGGWRGYMVIHD
jgi:hypothetical protein